MLADFGGTTLIVVGVVGALTFLVGWKRPFWALSALVLLIPFRDFSTRWMNVHTDLAVDQVTAIGRWWFAAIASLLTLAGLHWLLRATREHKLPRLEAPDLLLGLVVVVSIGATLASPEFAPAFTSLRGYLQPVGVFLVARAVQPRRGELRWLIALWLVAGLIMATLALWQALAWTEEDFRAEGYVRQDGDLVAPYGWIQGRRFVRPASTVSGPNEVGLDMVLLFLMAVLAIPAIRRAAVPLAGMALLFTVGLAASLSRSAFLGFLASLAGLAGLHLSGLRRWYQSQRPREKAGLVAAGGIGIVAMASALWGFGLIRLLVYTVTNLSDQYHVLDSVRAVEYLLQHPQGVGMGLVEPKGALALIESGGTYHVEGSIFQIAMEMGVWGLAAWLAFWGAALARIYRNWHRLQTPELRVVAGSAFAGWLGSLVAFLFLPLMQSISLMVWLWFLLGAGYQSDRFEADWNASEQPAAVP
jgi:hypothetical protein